MDVLVSGDAGEVLAVWDDALTLMLAAEDLDGMATALYTVGGPVKMDALFEAYVAAAGSGTHHPGPAYAGGDPEHDQAAGLSSALEALADLGVVELGTDEAAGGLTVTLSRLGVWGVHRRLRAQGWHVPVLGGGARGDAAALLATLASCDVEDGEAEIAAWLAVRDGAEAARELIDAAGRGSPGLRGAGFAVLDRIGGEAVPAVRAALDDPVLHAHAAVWLHEHGEEADLVPGDRAWLLVDRGQGSRGSRSEGRGRGTASRCHAGRAGGTGGGAVGGQPPGRDRPADGPERSPPRPGRGQGRPQGGVQGPFARDSPGGLPGARPGEDPDFVDCDCLGQGRGTGRDGTTISVKPIRIFGDPVLRTSADPVTDFDAELRRLVKDLTDTMLDAPGVGLAAPQIGVSLRVFTYHVDDQLGHLINPSLDLSAEEETDDEGCLPFPGLAFPTKRAYGVVAKGFNMHGEPVTLEGSGHLARCVQHETDHLDGVFIDRLDPVTRKLAMKEIREAEWWERAGPAGQDLAAPHVGQGVLRCG